MLVGPMMANAARADGFNPYYGLVVKDLGDPGNYGVGFVLVLWEDGRERKFPRNVLMSWSELPKDVRP